MVDSISKRWVAGSEVNFDLASSASVTARRSTRVSARVVVTEGAVGAADDPLSQPDALTGSAASTPE